MIFPIRFINKFIDDAFGMACLGCGLTVIAAVALGLAAVMLAKAIVYALPWLVLILAVAFVVWLVRRLFSRSR